VRKAGKYTPERLLPALRLFAAARNQALAVGFTDNGGAIHSVERILDILGQRLRYPHLSHINQLKTDESAEASVAAHEARCRGDAVNIEHVAPLRALAKEVVSRIDQGMSDEELLAFIRGTYRLVLLTQEETRALNRANRSRLTEDRIAEAGIRMWGPRGGGSG
jgi:hypothetical protein